MNCSECGNKFYCLDLFEGLRKVDILFIQDCFKVEQGGVNGYKSNDIRQLRKSFLKGNSDYKFEFTNLVNRFFQTKPKKVDIENCINFLETVIKKTHPSFIIAIGSTVFNTLLGKDKKFKTWVGRLINYGERKLIPIYHPAYASKSTLRQREYASQLQNALKQISGDFEDISRNHYDLITDKTEIIDLLGWLTTQENTPQAFDYETTHLIPAMGLPVCLSISYAKKQGYCFYFFDRDEFREKGTNSKFTDTIKAAIKKWMLSPVPKIAQNAKFEIKWTINHFKCEPINIVGDTKQIAHLLDENSQNKLSDLAYQRTTMGGYDTPMLEFLEQGHEHWEASPEFMLPYSAGDSDCCRRVYFEQMKDLLKDFKLTWLYHNIVSPGIYTLARMEERGMKLDIDKMTQVEIDLTNKAEELEKTINKFPEVKETIKRVNVGKKGKKVISSLNFKSPIQMRVLLYAICKLPVQGVSKASRLPSTDQEALKHLKDKHSIVNSIVDLKSCLYQLTELETIVNKMIDGRVFSDMVQDYVATGRLSSRAPNLQNMKGDHENDPSYVKECFISRFEGGGIMQADFSQLELKLTGSESGELKFIVAFRNDVDMHSMTGKDLIGVTLEEFLKHKDDKYKNDRRDAKSINFGIPYGITEIGLSKKMDCTEEQAKDKLSIYWNSYPYIYKWDKANQKEATKNLHIRNTIGRIRHLPDAVSNNFWLRSRALRQCTNFKIQSLGADITMYSMAHIDRLLIENECKSCVIGQIHDSVLIDVHPSEKVFVQKVVEYVMEVKTNKLFTFLKIPLTIDVEYGESWSGLKKIEKLS